MPRKFRSIASTLAPCFPDDDLRHTADTADTADSADKKPREKDVASQEEVQSFVAGAFSPDRILGNDAKYAKFDLEIQRPFRADNLEIQHPFQGRKARFLVNDLEEDFENAYQNVQVYWFTMIRRAAFTLEEKFKISKYGSIRHSIGLRARHKPALQTLYDKLKCDFEPLVTFCKPGKFPRLYGEGNYRYAIQIEYHPEEKKRLKKAIGSRVDLDPEDVFTDPRSWVYNDDPSFVRNSISSLSLWKGLV